MIGKSIINTLVTYWHSISQNLSPVFDILEVKVKVILKVKGQILKKITHFTTKKLRLQEYMVHSDIIFFTVVEYKLNLFLCWK